MNVGVLTTRMVLEETEKDLIEGCRRGDSAAFRSLFERHKDRVYSIALRYSGDPAIAQDIAQDTFLKLFDGIRAFRGDSNFESWLYRLIVNACFDQKRKTRRLTPLLDGVLDFMRAPGADALDEVLRAEVSGQVRDVVESLPPDQRMLIVLRYTEGLPYDRIAEALGCPAGTVASRLNRTHKAIETKLARLAGKSRRGND